MVALIGIGQVEVAALLINQKNEKISNFLNGASSMVHPTFEDSLLGNKMVEMSAIHPTPKETQMSIYVRA